MSMITEQVEYLIKLSNKHPYYSNIPTLQRACKEAANTIAQLAAKVRAENNVSQPCEDAISRKAVINQIFYSTDNNGDVVLGSALRERIASLPSVTPQEPTLAQERYEDLCEYFGDAKDILNSREDFKAWLDRVKWHIHKAEELYEKYEQEPCEDVISRQAVLDKKELIELEDGQSFYYISPEDVETLPSVNPQPCDDAISRQAAIDAIDALYLDGDSSISYRADAEGDTLIGKYQAITALDDLLPVNPQPKVGHWIEVDTNMYACSNCSHCFSIVPEDNSIKQYKYCPNCKCRMIEPQESEG